MGLGMLVNTPSVVAALGMVVAVATVGMGIACAVKPDERRLALMRPLTLATIFAALCTFTVGLANILQGIGHTSTMTAVSWGMVALGASESLIPLFTGFASLTVAWLLVAVGLRRG
jgi:hypothetical protein